METFFDIRSGRWIKALRVITILIAIAFIIAGFVIGIRDANGKGKDRLYFEDAEFFEFVVWFLAGIAVSVVYTVASMALIQLLDNVETLRKNLIPTALQQMKKVQSSVFPNSLIKNIFQVVITTNTKSHAIVNFAVKKM